MHGIRVIELTTGARPIAAAATAIIGLVATSSGLGHDATTFPLNKAVLVTDVRGAIGDAGVAGTLKASLSAIADQCSPVIVVVVVDEGADDAATALNVIGGTEADGSYSGLKALLAAEAQLGVRPRIIGAPGLEVDETVIAALATTAKQLNGFAYAKPAADSVAEAVAARPDYSARELMLIWPEFSGFAGQAVAIALGTRARIDEETGWHKSLSNVGVNGVTGLSHDVFFDLQDSSNDAGLLNGADITTLVRMRGFRFWGNRTCSDEPLFAFEPVVRSAQAIRDECAAGLAWAVDKPLTPQVARDIIETINGRLRYLVSIGRLIGGEAYFDASANPKAQLAAGKLVIDFDFTPTAPLEGLTINQRITDRFYGDLGALIG